MDSALLIGESRFLEQAYPPPLLEKLGGRLNILEPRVTEFNWKEHKSLLRKARLILATWEMPRMDEEFLSQADSLEAVFYAAGSIKSFATEKGFAQGIKISSAWMANAVPVAEYVLSTVLLSLKNFWRHADQTRRFGTWQRLPVAGTFKSMVGLVSLGATGQATARQLQRCDLDVIAYDPFASPEMARRLDVRLVPLEELFEISDVISLHCPALPETHHLINTRLLRRMKPNATLINTARGSVLNEDDLCTVLKERPDLTAILDVTDPEPPAGDSELFTLPNIIVTPHIAGSLDREIGRMGEHMAEEVDRFLDEKSLQHEVTLEMLNTAA